MKRRTISRLWCFGLQAHEESRLVSREHEETKRQIEEDADHEILDIKNTYEKKLREEKEANLKLKGKPRPQNAQRPQTHTQGHHERQIEIVCPNPNSTVCINLKLKSTRSSHQGRKYINSRVRAELGPIHTTRNVTHNAMQANGTCCCQWECSHCWQATSKEKIF